MAIKVFENFLFFLCSDHKPIILEGISMKIGELKLLVTAIENRARTEKGIPVIFFKAIWQICTAIKPS